MWKSFDDKYECSDDGHIRNRKTKKILREYSNRPDGYLRTQFGGKTRTVHRVIAETFLEKEKEKNFINHKDGNKTNNNIDNLEWCTRSENIRHAYNNGLIHPKKGENNGRAKLSQEDVEYIRSVYRPLDPNYGAKALAKVFGVAPQTISAVVYKQNWR